MKLNNLKKLLVLFFVLILFLSGCKNKNNDKFLLNPDSIKLASVIRDALKLDKNLILSIGTGLCENCKIVEETLEKYKSENENDIEILIYTNYADRDTFTELRITVSPTTLFIDKNHLVLKKVVGSFNDSDLLNYLKETGFNQ